MLDCRGSPCCCAAHGSSCTPQPWGTLPTGPCCCLLGPESAWHFGNATLSACGPCRCGWGPPGSGRGRTVALAGGDVALGAFSAVQFRRARSRHFRPTAAALPASPDPGCQTADDRPPLRDADLARAPCVPGGEGRTADLRLDRAGGIEVVDRHAAAQHGRACKRIRRGRHGRPHPLPPPRGDSSARSGWRRTCSVLAGHVPPTAPSSPATNGATRSAASRRWHVPSTTEAGGRMGRRRHA